MPAYVIANVEITDPVAFAQYLERGPATVTAYAGSYVARRGAVEVLEGEWSPKSITILRFDDLARARAWYDSPEYRPLKQIRHKAAKTKMWIVEGL